LEEMVEKTKHRNGISNVTADQLQVFSMAAAKQHCHSEDERKGGKQIF
jgi:hypothetical protein